MDRSDQSENKLKILIIAPISKKKWGGVAVAATNMINCLKQFPKINVVTVDINTKPYFASNKLQRFFKLITQPAILFIRILRKIENVNILHVHASNDWGLMPIYPSLLAAALCQKKLVVTYHINKLNFKKYYHFFILTNKLIDRHIILSRYLESEFKLSKINYDIVPNILDVELFSSRIRENVKPNIMWARHMSPLYRLEDSLRILHEIKKEFPTVKMTIIGNCEDRLYEKKIKDLVKELDLANNLDFKGMIFSREEISRLFDKSDIFLNTSEMDIYPMALLEACAAGHVVVTSDAGGIPYMISNRNNGYVCRVGHIDEFAQQILSILNHPREQVNVSKNAIEFAENHKCNLLGNRLLSIYTIISASNITN